MCLPLYVLEQIIKIGLGDSLLQDGDIRTNRLYPTMLG